MLRLGHILLLVIAFPLVFGQKEAANNAALASNMKQFQEIYGLAQQLMSLGGNILNNAQSRSPSTEFSRDSGGNGIFGDVRPQLKSVSNFDGYDRYDKYGASNSEYGGGLLGTGSQSKPRSIIDTLMGSFLGSSLSGSQSSSSSTSSIFHPTFDEYGGKQSRYGNTGQGSNIEEIVSALSRTGAKRAIPEDSGGFNAGSLLSQFFGRR